MCRRYGGRRKHGAQVERCSLIHREEEQTKLNQEYVNVKDIHAESEFESIMIMTFAFARARLYFSIIKGCRDVAFFIGGGVEY